jgi:HEAT repeat protein
MDLQRDTLIARLVGRLADRNPNTRRNAAAALRLNGARAVAAIPALMALLADEDVRVRREAAQAVECLRMVEVGWRP